MIQSDAPSRCEPARPAVRVRRVLMVSTAMGAGGGAEEQIIAMSQVMKARGVEVRIVSLLPTCPMPGGFEKQGIPVLHLAMRKSIPDPRAIGRYNRIVRDFAPDVVHTHLVHANLLGRIARLTQPVPALICTLHSLTMTGVTRDWSPVFELAHRLTDRLCDRTTAICRAAADYAVRRGAVPAEKMTVLQNGIDTAQFAPDARTRASARRELGIESRFIWLAAGRLEIQKAYPVLLKAMSLLDKEALLLICGQGSQRAELEEAARGLGAADRVRFMGLRSDIPRLMNAADAMVLSSDIEGLPLVLLQAAASGLPIVATEVGGNGEAVLDGRNGRLVPPQSPAALAAAMREVMTMPAEKRLEMGTNGRERIGRLFDMQRVVDRWLALYTEVLKSRQKSAKGSVFVEERKGAVLFRSVG